MAKTAKVFIFLKNLVKFVFNIVVFYIISIFFRILTFIKNNLGVGEISSFISKYFPESIPSIIYKYTDGVVSTILIWIYVLMFAMFLFYTVRILGLFITKLSI